VSPKQATDPGGSGKQGTRQPRNRPGCLWLRPHAAGSGVFECFSELMRGAVVLICGQRMTASEDEGNRPFQHAQDAERPNRGVIGEPLRLGQAHRPQHRKSHPDVAGVVHLQCGGPAGHVMRSPAAADLMLLRQRLLDELERRDRAGFGRWLSTGARAASDPSRDVGHNT